MYCLRLFIVVLQDLHCLLQCLLCILVLCSLKSMCVPSFILIGCCVSELHGHLCAHCNVWPEAVYCCFTRTTLFIKLVTCLYDRSCYHITKFCYSIPSGF